MNISKCKTCKHYDSFFGACTLYQEVVYMGEGECDYRFCRIKDIEPDECEYKRVKE